MIVIAPSYKKQNPIPVDAERIRSASVYSTGAFSLIATEDPMFMNNDFSEQPRIHAVGVLPTRRPAEFQRELKSNDPAVHAMTDFTSKFAITVAPERQIDAALTDMMRLGVRSMLVMRADSVIGLITSYDDERGTDVLRGLISRSRIERQLQVSEFLPRVARGPLHRNNYNDGRS
jgi:hypothetical protein